MGWAHVEEEPGVEVLGRGGDTMEGTSELKVGPLMEHFPSATSLHPIDPVRLCVSCRKDRQTHLRA